METKKEDLVGNLYEYVYSSGMTVKLMFTAERANWEILEGEAKGMTGSDKYEVKVVDNNVYFVQWHEPENRTTITLLIDEQKKKVYGSGVYPDMLDFDEAVIQHLTRN
ncbi:MAG: MoaF N-terminal domain-containing protein [Bacteroidota bacterium]